MEGAVALNQSLARPADQILHPWAWWAWAIALAAMVNLTLNPLLLTLVMLAVISVVLLRRSDAPWARSIAAYFWLAGFVIVMRMIAQMVLGGGGGSIVVFRLPEVTLPEWAAGIRLGGAVTAEGLLYTLYDGLRLAAMLLCIAAANALANPRRALRSVPAALHDISVAVVISLSVAPQLVESAARVRRARRLRGGSRGLSVVTALAVPIIADAVDRSLALATSMEARGFGRTRTTTAVRRSTNALLLASLMVLTFAGFLMLSASGSTMFSLPLFALGITGVVIGLRRSGTRQAVTRYRPDPWGLQEWIVTGCGLMALAAVLALQFVGPPSLLTTPTAPPAWPELHPLMLVSAAAAAAPIAFTRAPGTAQTAPTPTLEPVVAP